MIQAWREDGQVAAELGSTYDRILQQHRGNAAEVNRLFIKTYREKKLIQAALWQFGLNHRVDWKAHTLSRRDLRKVAQIYRRFKSHRKAYSDRVIEGEKEAPRLNAKLGAARTEAEYYAWVSARVYYPLKKGDTIPGMNDRTYEVDQAIHGEHGLHAYIFKPTQGDKPPIIAFRGTDMRNGANLRDDARIHLGKTSFDANKEVLTQVVDRLGQCVITGHSLGGTLSQRLAAEKPDKVSDVYHYNAPGVGWQIPGDFAELPEAQRPKIHATYHARDLGYRSGLWHLPADDELVAEAPGPRIGRADAHNIEKLAQCLTDGHVSTPPPRTRAGYVLLQVTHGLVELLRRIVAPIFQILAHCLPHPDHVLQRVPIHHDSMPGPNNELFGDMREFILGLRAHYVDIDN